LENFVSSITDGAMLLDSTIMFLLTRPVVASCKTFYLSVYGLIMNNLLETIYLPGDNVFKRAWDVT